MPIKEMASNIVNDQLLDLYVCAIMNIIYDTIIHYNNYGGS